MTGLRYKTVKGVIWTSMESGGQFLIQFIITIVLARLLSPQDFGVIAMLVIFTELSKVIIDSGYSQALIRKKDADQRDFSSIFYLNILIAIIIYFLFFSISPWIADFYHYSELKNIARVVFVSFVINSLGIVPNAIIVRNLNFKILAKRTLLSSILSGIFGIILAYHGFGVWSLVFQTLMASLLRVILIWNYSKWKPSGSISYQPIKSMFGFSGNLMISGVLDVIVSNIQSLIIGKYYTKNDLGYYSQAKRLQTIPSYSIVTVIQTVIYPILSRIQDENERLRNSYRKVISVAVLFVFPLMFLFIGISDNLFYVVLSKKWMPAVAYFRPLCLMGALYPMYSINLNIFKVKGRSDLFLRVEIIKRIITFTLVIITSTVSVLALVWGQVIATLLNTIITMVYSGQLIEYKMKIQFLDLARIALISVTTGMIAYEIGRLMHNEPRLFQLLIQLVGSGVFFIIVLIIFDSHKINLLKEVVSEISNKNS